LRKKNFQRREAYCGNGGRERKAKQVESMSRAREAEALDIEVGKPAKGRTERNGNKVKQFPRGERR